MNQIKAMALNAASVTCAGREVTADYVVKMAKEFEDYLNG